MVHELGCVFGLDLGRRHGGETHRTDGVPCGHRPHARLVVDRGADAGHPAAVGGGAEPTEAVIVDGRGHRLPGRHIGRGEDYGPRHDPPGKRLEEWVRTLRPGGTEGNVANLLVHVVGDYCLVGVVIPRRERPLAEPTRVVRETPGGGPDRFRLGRHPDAVDGPTDEKGGRR